MLRGWWPNVDPPQPQSCSAPGAHAFSLQYLEPRPQRPRGVRDHLGPRQPLLEARLCSPTAASCTCKSRAFTWGLGASVPRLCPTGVPSGCLRTPGARWKTLWCRPICAFCCWGNEVLKGKGSCSNLHSQTGNGRVLSTVLSPRRVPEPLLWSQGDRNFRETEARQKDVKWPSGQCQPTPRPEAP